MAKANPLPPGSNWPPLLGETLDFASNPFAFIHQRRASHGDVFRTSILGSPTVFFVGPKLADTYIDPANIQREGAMPTNIMHCWRQSGHVPLLEDKAHSPQAEPSREAVAGYLPVSRAR